MSLAGEFRAHWAARGWGGPEDTVVVAVSGGLDSMVLLHLLRFGLEAGPRPVVAHYDHGMRPDSDADLLWLRGVCRGWGLTLVCERPAVPPESEAGARELRYRFLHAVREGVAARSILTAHHADDQAETVLHRVLRGTGPDGLAGIARERDPGVVRPLLEWRRETLEAYADAVGLRWRVDPTNTDRGFTRNWIRHGLLPAIDERMGQGPRRALVRLAEISGRDAEAWESVLDRLQEELVRAAPNPEEIALDREGLLELHPGVRARLLRRLLERRGAALTGAQTGHLLDFVRNAASGSELRELRGVRVSRSFGDIVVGPVAGGVTEPLKIDRGAGSGLLRLHGRTFRVSWGPGEPGSGGWVERFGRARLELPGVLREWRAGDRMTLDFGTKKLKKLFGEARVPARDRERRPVFVDGRERVLWVPGVARSTWALPEETDDLFTIAVQEDHG